MKTITVTPLEAISAIALHKLIADRDNAAETLEGSWLLSSGAAS